MQNVRWSAFWVMTDARKSVANVAVKTTMVAPSAEEATGMTALIADAVITGETGTVAAEATGIMTMIDGAIEGIDTTDASATSIMTDGPTAGIAMTGVTAMTGVIDMTDTTGGLIAGIVTVTTEPIAIAW